MEPIKGGNYGLLNTYANFSKVADRIKKRDAPGQIFDHRYKIPVSTSFTENTLSWF